MCVYVCVCAVFRIWFELMGGELLVWCDLEEVYRLIVRHSGLSVQKYSCFIRVVT